MTDKVLRERMDHKRKLYQDFLALQNDKRVAWNNYIGTKLDCYRKEALLCEELEDIAYKELLAFQVWEQ